jgi:hypothetical protein
VEQSYEAMTSNTPRNAMRLFISQYIPAIFLNIFYIFTNNTTMALRKITYEALCKRLGEVDKERREILKALRNSPEYITKHVADTLKAFATNGNWFARKNAKGEHAYFRLAGFVLNDKKITQTGRGSVLVSATLTWDYFDYQATEKKKSVDQIQISAFNEIEEQILNGRFHVPEFSEKKVMKTVLTAKKAELEDQLKKLKAEIAAI